MYQVNSEYVDVLPQILADVNDHLRIRLQGQKFDQIVTKRFEQHTIFGLFKSYAFLGDSVVMSGYSRPELAASIAGNCSTPYFITLFKS